MEHILTDIPNLFVKGNLTFIYGGKPQNFDDIVISNYGVTNLPWTISDPRQMVGHVTEAELTLLVGDKRVLRTKAEFIAERSKGAIYLGLRFTPTAQVRMDIDRAIEKHGTVPTTHVRKYPRIPAMDMIATMPMNAIMTYQKELIVTRIANLSPNGALLASDNPKIALMEPGERVNCQLEPRGDFFATVRFDGLVCRILDERDAQTRNTIRYIGLRFTHFAEGHKESFLSLLQDILLRMKIDLERKRSKK